tara:strand:+ start:150 stop:413 length:264 start_codon:yes stop_codon:yes gene_type:complete
VLVEQVVLPVVEEVSMAVIVYLAVLLLQAVVMVVLLVLIQVEQVALVAVLLMATPQVLGQTALFKDRMAVIPLQLVFVQVVEVVLVL